MEENDHELETREREARRRGGRSRDEDDLGARMKSRSSGVAFPKGTYGKNSRRTKH